MRGPTARSLSVGSPGPAKLVESEIRSKHAALSVGGERVEGSNSYYQVGVGVHF